MPLRKVLLATFILSFPLSRVEAKEVTNIPEIGAHQPILIVRKNVHPQNWMVVYTKVGANGRFLPDPSNADRPVFDFYWLMDGKTYKPVNPTIKKEICKRFECQWSDGGTRLAINVNDLKQVDSDIGEPKIDVYSTGSDGAREVEAQIDLGPSDGNKRIRLSSIYTEGRTVPPAVHSVTLKGEEIVNGKITRNKVARKYDAKK